MHRISRCEVLAERLMREMIGTPIDPASAPVQFPFAMIADKETWSTP